MINRVKENEKVHERERNRDRQTVGGKSERD
jgi:hypothetical protein